MRTHNYYTAIILVSAAQKIISKRREMEAACGYPPEYGDDELLLQRIDEFLSDEDIQHGLKEGLEFWKEFRKDDKRLQAEEAAKNDKG